MNPSYSQAKGRGSPINPPNRFGGPYYLPILEPVEHNPPTEYIPDHARTIVTENNSPDVGFRYSVNPYRGCSHGCAYCYARPTHEYLGLSAGLDFETKIFVKEAAPELFREFLARPSWQPQPIALSGVTDPYQPAERRFLLTRRCLEVAVEACQPISLITKNALVLRDLDLLRRLAAANLIHVNMSVTTLDAALARSLEPRTSTPAARLEAIRQLRQAGVPVRVFIAPVIPGLTDSEIPAILAATAQAGAQAAAFMLLRLPGAVAPVFRAWLAQRQPSRAARIEGRIRGVRGGKLNEAAFGKRMRGTGEMAQQITQLFRLFCRKHGLDGGLPPYDCSRFRPPREKNGQQWLF
jgi:DNA repair photolyase